ncbi:DUF1501 domain-containing protein [Streptomyces armeniacus]|uniref:DUF1501 domain-containing protein n=1 Tax=Streptomyces armeniacus TaxID=83291 RepID=A0A345XWL9_9ACTN|nr:DUF1501 domain-containing protein [Streptomyces armeniacus]AXK36035.1 DUF1501 domain-containing protein [Streptomyces armeniacus]
MKTTVDTWTRRRFLAASGVTAAGALAAGGAYSVQDLLGSAGRDGDGDSGAQGSRILVLVTLYGGNDGLNTLVPAGDSAYHDARPDLAYDEDEVLPLGDELGLNPGLKGFKSLWDKDRLAVVRGVSYPQPDHSHFRSMAIWQTASPGTPAPSGWLGRWLDAQDDPDPLRAVSIGATLPPLLAGEKTAGAAVQLGGMRLPDAWRTVCSYLAEGHADDDHPLRRRAAESIGDLVTVTEAYGGQDARDGQSAQDGKGARDRKDAQDGSDAQGESGDEEGPADPNDGEDEDRPTDGASAGGQSELAAQLSVVARALEANAPTRVHCVSLGGFDTHANEKQTQSRLLGRLDHDIADFLQRIRGTKAGSRVVVAVYSEFGRRVKANANQGTDHGTAGPVFVLGEPVKGGFYGDQPSLTDLKDDDLRMTTDFRDVYATLLERVLGTEPGRILGGHDRTLGFL